MVAAGRERMVASAAALVGSRGMRATSFTEVLTASGAPRGSIYHYFPGGKRELIREALEHTRKQILAYQQGCGARTPAGVLEHFVAVFRASLVVSECRAGCPVAGVVLTAGSDGPVYSPAVRASFRAWTSLLAEQLIERGVARARARTVAATTLAAVEGALILCRAEGSIAPLDAVTLELRRLLPAERPGSSRRPRAR